MRKICATVFIVICFSALHAQDKLVTSKLVIPPWLNIAIAESNQLKGGHHVYTSWNDYQSNMAKERVVIGMLLTILDPSGEGTNKPKLYRLKEWKIRSTMPLQDEWGELFEIKASNLKGEPSDDPSDGLSNGTYVLVSDYNGGFGWTDITSGLATDVGNILLTDGRILVGGINGKATSVKISGDATLDSAGKLTLVDGAVAASKLGQMSAVDGQAIKWDSSANAGNGGWVASSVGDMFSSVYDTNEDNVVDLAEDANTVNKLTVETAVPPDAIFTDDQSAAEVMTTARGNLSSVNVQLALEELQGDIDAGIVRYSADSTYALNDQVVYNGKLYTNSDDITGGEPFNASKWSVVSGVDNLGNHTATQNIRLGNLFITGDGDDEGIRINDSGQLIIGNDTVAGVGTVLFADGDEETNYRLKLQAPDEMGSNRTITFPDASGTLVLDKSDTTRTFIKNLSGGSAVDVVVNLKTLDTGIDLLKGSGTALGFSVPASKTGANVVPGEGDSAFVGNNASGALVQTAMIAARKTSGGDADLDTEIAFYTRKNGILDNSVTISDDGALRVSKELVPADRKDSASVITVLHLGVTDVDNDLDLEPGNGVGIDFHIPYNSSTIHDNARIAAVRTGDDTVGNTQLSFYTRKSGKLLERMVIRDDGGIDLGKDSSGSPGMISLHDDDDNTTNKLTLQTVSTLNDERTITFPDTTGMVEVFQPDMTRTFVKKLSGASSVDVVLNLKTLDPAVNLGVGAGTALGFSVPASTKHVTVIGDNDAGEVGGNEIGALVSTAMIAARKTEGADADLDTDLAFYTRKDGELSERMVISDDGHLKLSGSLTTNEIKIGGDHYDLILKKEKITGSDKDIKFPNKSGTVALLSDIGDSLVNQIAYKNIVLGNYYLSGDGDDEGLTVDTDGNVGIGTQETFGYKLAVNGIIGAQGVKVELTSPWPDYVFADDYELKDLVDLENYISEHKHLPGIPSQEAVEKDGVEIGDMNVALLEKIEELTLYIIDLNKRLKVLETENMKYKAGKY